MSDLNEYKCPACGGAMEFDSKSQKMKCPYCDTEMDVQIFMDAQQQQQGTTDGNGAAGSSNWESMSNGQWQAGETQGMRVYVCQSCGGEIVAEESTGATTCPFCGNRVVMKGQFEGGLKPDYIIPFKLDKKDAKNAYYRHLKGKHFLPRVFKQENHIDEIKGVYVPFWLFDADVQADMRFEATNVHVWESGDTEYTETEYYDVQRSGGVSFMHIPLDGSKKMDDTLMESIEPYQFSDAVPFQSAYLAGYVADRYDVEVGERLNRARERIENSAEMALKSTIQGYTSVTANYKNVNIYNAQYWYAMYPVWLLNTTWQGKKYTFAMNGQTGKMVGDLPMDKGAFWRYVGISGVIIGVLIYALMWLIVLI